ncbi:Uncharacterized damage-inducible protein DinB (forms a four-helix bundle) [Cohnella sp. OV330]|uniref:DinB family protein n=1 Tax=Cohnella sp. OV330 TaxID=1855288 RepID=UPI0008E25094|nr:DinB family protein [Cohnella sp. OV330]SFB04190.1 Uncharacterized damage-inducible protein DinB (forms a four-helix bundle) [Cohnella sp. OV330]
MSLIKLLKEELHREAASTRRLIEIIPEASLAWRPHAKSMSLGQLALHLAGLSEAVAAMLASSSHEVPTVPLPEAESVPEILALLERSTAAAAGKIREWSDDDLQQPFSWTLGGKAIASTSRYEQVRSTLLNHCYHHRGQLTVYLRVLDVPIPGIYGPSADEH